MAGTAAEYAAKLAALGQEARLEIVRRLLKHHPDGLVVGALLAELDVAPSTLSHHLDTLQRNGLIRQERDGKFLRCFADVEGLTAIVTFLTEECCGGTSTSSSPKKARG